MLKSNRKNVAKKMASFIKTAQKEDLPEVEDLDVEDELNVEDEMEMAPEKDMGEEHQNVEEEALESIEEKLEEIDDKLDTVVDAMEDNAEVIEDLLEKPEEEFENFKDDENDLDEEWTSEEFGFDTKGTPEKDMKTSNLRKLRNTRLNAYKKKALKDYGEEKTLKEEFNEPASTNKKFSPQSPVVTMNKVPKSDTIPDMLKLAELSLKKSKDSWVVINSSTGDKLYIIPRNTVNEKVFASKKFAESVIGEMAKNGIGNTLKKYKAVKVVDAKEKETYLKHSKADVRRRFLRAVRLALTAMNKNLVKQVPLKRALFEIMDRLGVDQAANIIEAAFAKSAAEHFEVAIAQAEKYMDMSDEAFVETENMIGESEVNLPKMDDMIQNMNASAAAKHQETLKQQAANHSLLISTRSDSDESNDRRSLLNMVMPKPSLFGLKRFE